MPESGVPNEEALPGFRCLLDQSSGSVVRVVVTGELDLVTAAALERALHHAHAGGRLIVLDLGGVSFCDSTGLHLIVRANQRARDEGRRLVIVCGSKQVQRLFALTGVDEQLEIVEDAAMATEQSAEPKLVARRSR
jgi:anti-sigma B factor antagonist